MTSVTGRPRTALVVVDVQNGVVAGAHERDAVVANVAGLVDRARAAQVPVVRVQDSSEQLPEGSEEWAYVPELVRQETEPLVAKRWGDAFEETDLEQVLAGLGVGRLVVAGAATDACIRATLHGAPVRGHDALLVSDVHPTEDRSPRGAPPPEQVIAHTNLYRAEQRAPGRAGGPARAADVDFSVATADVAG